MQAIKRNRSSETNKARPLSRLDIHHDKQNKENQQPAGKRKQSHSKNKKQRPSSGNAKQPNNKSVKGKPTQK
jgi:hypothetical protein